MIELVCCTIVQKPIQLSHTSSSIVVLKNARWHSEAQSVASVSLTKTLTGAKVHPQCLPPYSALRVMRYTLQSADATTLGD